ncbi:MAG: DUF2845 domain-containing protein [Stenotrophobium sp.]
MRARCLTVLVFCLWAAQAQASGSLRCGSRIVSEGDSVAALLAACGEPAYRDVWSLPNGYDTVAGEEQWYYNFGSNLLLRVIRLRAGRVVDIGSDGYGYNEPPHPPCDPDRIVEGLSKFRLVLACGAPFTRRTIGYVMPYAADDFYRYGGYAGAVFREEWVYNFGPRRYLLVVTLENGRVVDVQNDDSRGSD